MMKTLCVAVVVLSFTSVCQAASLACEKLLKPVDKDPNLPGIWYAIAWSTKTCLATNFFNTVFWPSAEVDITSTDQPNIYSSNFKVKIYGYCQNVTEEFLYARPNMFDVDSNNAPTGKPDVLLQTGCPDCMVIKWEDEGIMTSFFSLFSRRKNITDAELKEFESQAECLGWAKPQVLDTDHDFESCLSVDDDDDIDTDKISSMISQRLSKTYSMSLKCLSDTVLHYPNVAYEWVKQQWSTFYSILQ